MPASTFLGPTSAPYRTKNFWILVALFAVLVLCAPLIQSLLGLSPFPLRVQISSGAITFILVVAMLWFGLRFGRVAWFTIAIFFLTFGLFILLHRG
jgi:hypothetical protein